MHNFQFFSRLTSNKLTYSRTADLSKFSIRARTIKYIKDSAFSFFYGYNIN